MMLVFHTFSILYRYLSRDVIHRHNIAHNVKISICKQVLRSRYGVDFLGPIYIIVPIVDTALFIYLKLYLPDKTIWYNTPTTYRTQ